MSDYHFVYEGVISIDKAYYTDFAFTDAEYGAAMRSWSLSFDYDVRRFFGNLRISENRNAGFEDWRPVTDLERNEMIALLPLDWKLRLALFV